MTLPLQPSLIFFWSRTLCLHEGYLLWEHLPKLKSRSHRVDDTSVFHHLDSLHSKSYLSISPEHLVPICLPHPTCTVSTLVQVTVISFLKYCNLPFICLSFSALGPFPSILYAVTKVVYFKIQNGLCSFYALNGFIAFELKIRNIVLRTFCYLSSWNSLALT